MKFQIEAAKRLAKINEVNAADATDAGKALAFLESHLGKAKKLKDSSSDSQTVVWKTPDFEGEFILHTKNGLLTLTINFGYYSLHADGFSFEEFQKSFKKQVKYLLKITDSDLERAEKRP